MRPFELAQATIAKRGFTKVSETTKVVLMQNFSSLKDVYILIKNEHMKCIFHPLEPKISDIAKLSGVIDDGLYFYSNMRTFPERQNRGKLPTRCGYGFRFQDTNALNNAISLIVTP